MENLPDNHEESNDSQEGQAWDSLRDEVPFNGARQKSSAGEQPETLDSAEQDKKAKITEKLGEVCDEMGIEKTDGNLRSVMGILRSETRRQNLLEMHNQATADTDQLQAELDKLDEDASSKGLLGKISSRRETDAKRQELDKAIKESLRKEWSTSHEAETIRRKSAQVARSFFKDEFPIIVEGESQDEFMAREESARRKFLASPVAKELGTIDEAEYGKTYHEYTEPGVQDVQLDTYENYVGMRDL